MQPIIAPIKPSQTGSVAVNLIECILFLISKKLLKIYVEPNRPTQSEIDLLVEGAKKEMVAQVFGESAQRLVFYFQIQHGLGDALRGAVDEKTAKFLNELLVKLGEPIETHYWVVGTIINGKTNSGLENVVVRAFDADGAILTMLGQCRTDSKGNYRVDFESSAFRNTKAERGGPDLVIDIFDEKGEIKLARSKRHNNSAATTVINLTIDVATFCVYGTVTDNQKQPQAKMIVTAWDRDLRKRQILGTATTDEKGDYSIFYRNDQFALADMPGRKTPWLVVEVKRDDNDQFEKSIELKPSETKPIQRVDVELNVSSKDQLTEWEVVSRAIKPLLIGQGDKDDELFPNALTPNDIQFITIETNIDSTIINIWCVAYTMQERAIELLSGEHATEAALVNKLGWPLFYGLCRQLSVSTLQGLQSLSFDTLTRAIDSAQQQRLLPVVAKEDSILFCQCIELLRQLQQVQSDITNLHPIAQMTSVLEIAVSTKIKLAAFAILEKSGNADPDSLLSLHEEFPKDTQSIDRFIQGMRLNQLADGNSVLMKSLDSHLSNDGDSVVSLAGLAVNDWINVALQSNVTSDAAMVMLNKMELIYPVEAFQSRFKNKNFPSMSDEVTKGIQQVLQNNPEKVREYMQGRTRVLNQIEDPTEKALNTMGLFGRLGLPYEVSSDLIAINLDTPTTIIKYGKEAIIDLLKDKYGNGLARHLSDKIINTINDVNVIGHDVIAGAVQFQYVPLGWYIKPDQVAPDVRENIPSIPALLGDLDECICPPCESMLGQPAYLVDLLQLLNKQNPQAVKPLDFLRKRRLDIFNDLRLGCEQADTEVLHIDLAIEVMENAAIDMSHQANKDIALARLYKNLAHQLYPWFLPFDQQFLLRTAYLSKLGINDRQLDELTQHQFDENQNAASVLGIPYSATNTVASTEWMSLTQVIQGATLWKAYGFSPDNQNNVSLVDPASSEILNNQPISQIICRVSVLLDRTGLNLDDFEELIGQPYVGQLLIDYREQCKISQMRLNVGNHSLDVCLDRIHRMVRLQRKLNWSFSDINAALTMSAQGATLNKIIIQIARIKLLADTYHLPINLLCQFPQAYGSILRAIGINVEQRLCLEKILGIDVEQSSFSLSDLETLLAFNTLIDDTTLSISELGLSLLSYDDLQSIFPVLPVQVVSETELSATAAQLIDALAQEEERSSTVLTDEAIITLIASSIEISEQSVQPYMKFKISANQTVMKVLHQTNTSRLSNLSHLTQWLNCIFRLESIRAKFDSVVFDALLNSFDWMSVIATNSAVRGFAIESFVNWLWLAQPEKMGSFAVAEILALSASNDSSKFNRVIELFSIRLELGTIKVEELARLIGLSQNNFNGFKDALLVKRFFNLLMFAKQWRCDSNTIATLSSNNIAPTIELICKAKYSYTDNEWIQVKQKIENPIRQQKRDALVAELIRQNSQFKNAQDIYEYYLIDPLVEPCMNTTRILEAITATQLFAQRVLFGVEKYRDALNIEQTLVASQALKDQWVWMRNYRVWEANRKVFLFPENWLYPELRDDKSACFNLLESELGKGELSAELATQSFGKFLDDVAQTGQIQTLSMFEEVQWDNKQRTQRNLYMVGRTANPPYKYFWRLCNDFGAPSMEWLPWKMIELDISTDHVVAFVMAGRLGIAWPTLKSLNKSETNGTEKWRLDMSFSLMSGNDWSPVKTTRSEGFETTPPNVIDMQPFADERIGLTLRCSVSSDQTKTTVQAFVQNLIVGTASNVISGVTTSDLPVSLPDRYYEVQTLDQIKTLVREGFDRLTLENKQVFYAYFLHRAAANGGIKPGDFPNAGLGRTLDLVSSSLQFLNVFDFDWAREVYNTETKEDNFDSTGWVHVRELRDTIVGNTALRNALVNAFFDSLLSTFGYSGGIAGYGYISRVQTLLAGLANRKIQVSAWAKIRVSNVEGFYELKNTNGPFELEVSGSRHVIQLNDASTWVENRLGGFEPSTATLRWKGRSLSLPLESITAGTQKIYSLKLVFDGTSDPSALGLINEAVREYTCPVEFELSIANQIAITRPGPQKLSLPQVKNTVVYMNGFLEKEKFELEPYSENETSLSYEDQRGQKVVFSPSLRQRRFWVVGATQTDQVSQTFDVWSFREGAGKCLIDRNPYPAGLEIYPDGWHDSMGVAKAWYKNASLPSAAQQLDTFGSEKLPPTTLLAQDIWSGRYAFNSQLPYACYNWEIFFHAPLLIANQLSKQHQFEEAERWLRYVFDPTSMETGDDAKRFLKFRVFREAEVQSPVIDDLKAIAQAASGYYTTADIAAINKIISRWRQLPFRPFVIARSRHIAFLWRTLFAYVDNLITWADSLYRRDTRESNNEALMLYVLAHRILGRRPQQMKATTKNVAHTYDELAAKLDAFSNYWVDVASRAGGYAIQTDGHKFALVNKQPPTSAGALLFCMPHNDKLDRYWDVIEERLFNLRHCRNIEGITRDLPLVDSPIDPELLVRATAAGLDLSSVIAGLYAAPPHYRYAVLASRATELIGETRSLGSAMLSALEKRDAEQLAQLRSTNELALLQQVSELKKLQINEAEANINALRTSRKSTAARYNQYQRLLGLEMTAPDEGVAAGEESMLGQHDTGNSSAGSGLGLIIEEGQQYKGVDGANTWATAATISKVVGAASHTAASIVLATPAAVTPAPQILKSVGDSASLIGDSFSFVAQGWKTYAEQQGMLAGHLRRRDEWAFQSNQALKELQQIDKQILANQIRINITAKELNNHQLQLEQSQAVDEVMRSKFTSGQLYDWMSKELYSLYNKAYRMALEMARKAQAAAERELGFKKGSLDIIQSDHWNSMKQGLLAGERFYQDLKRLDVAYLDQSKREFELTKHISLRRLNPQALNELRFKKDALSKNMCEFDLPEWLFDLDTPGHYLRRIKSVSVSIPCVVGPYTSVNCKLTLLNSAIRYDQTNGVETDYRGVSESIVTSNANADSGLFETPLHDERFLPFEHAGVISSWRLELPDQYAQFDYSTISDVILTVRYTAREGGEQLRARAVGSIHSLLTATESTNPKAPLRFPLLLSCRSDFPTEWAKAKTIGERLKVSITKNFIPYWLEAASISSFHFISMHTLAGGALAEVDDVNMSVVDGVAVIDANVQFAQTSPSDIFLLFELGK